MASPEDQISEEADELNAVLAEACENLERTREDVAVIREMLGFPPRRPKLTLVKGGDDA